MTTASGENHHAMGRTTAKILFFVPLVPVSASALDDASGVLFTFDGYDQIFFTAKDG